MIRRLLFSFQVVTLKQEILHIKLLWVSTIIFMLKQAFSVVDYYGDRHAQVYMGTRAWQPDHSI